MARLERWQSVGCKLLRLITNRSATAFSILLLLHAPLTLAAAPVSKENRNSPCQEENRDIRPIRPGETVERDMAGGQTHYYALSMAASHYLRVLIDQKGIDVVLSVIGPDGTKMVESDSDNGNYGPEPASLITQTGGEYRVEVRSLDEKAPSGRYQIKIDRLRAALPEDRSRATAERKFLEGDHLRAQGKKDALEKATAKYQEALELLKGIGDPLIEGQSLHGLGRINAVLGDRQKALDYYLQALPFRRAAGDRRGEAVTTNSIAVMHTSLDDLTKALDYYLQALPIRREVGDLRGEAITISSLGTLYFYLGDMQKALEYYFQAIAIRREMGDFNRVASTTYSIGSVYMRLGYRDKALTYFDEAIATLRAAGKDESDATLLSYLAGRSIAADEKEKAIDYLQLQLAILKERGNRYIQAEVLMKVGNLYESLGDFASAMDHYEQSQAIMIELDHPFGQALITADKSRLYYLSGEYEKAIEHFNKTLPIFKNAGDKSAEAVTLLTMARLENKRGNLAQARNHVESAIGIIESYRAKIKVEELRSFYLARSQDYYEFAIDMFMHMDKLDKAEGHARAALEMSERARARTLLEMLTEGQADIRRGVEPSLLERERSLQQKINVKADRLTDLLAGEYTERQAAQLKREIEEIQTEYQEVQARIRATSPHYAALTQPAPLGLAEIQRQVLDSDTLLLEYSLGRERSFLWAITPDSFHTFELPKRQEIEDTARRVYDLLTARNKMITFETIDEKRERIARQDAEYPEAAAALSRMVLAPVASLLGNKRLLIVPDGALQYIPFAALPVPETRRLNNRTISVPYTPLIIKHEIVSLPSASTLAVLRRELAGRKPAPKTIAVLADPVFERDDRRVKEAMAQSGVTSQTVAQARSAGDLLESDLDRSAREVGLGDEGLHIPRLPYTRKEAQAISALVASAQTALDFTASRAAATSPNLALYRYVHFATHSILNSYHPELSGMVFSLIDERGEEQSGFLRAHEIYNLDFPAELVVLSGCRTGLGREIRGEGLVGLTRAFMYAGAARVAVSLWNVSDEGTAELMARFYRGVLGRQKLTAAAALRAAQLEMLKADRWHKPYYWAAFILQGEPR